MPTFEQDYNKHSVNNNCQPEEDRNLLRKGAKENELQLKRICDVRLTDTEEDNDRVIPEDPLPCCICNRDVMNNHRAIACDHCMSWVHANCDTMLEQEDYVEFCDNPQLAYLCPSCKALNEDTVQTAPITDTLTVALPQKRATSENSSGKRPRSLGQCHEPENAHQAKEKNIKQKHKGKDLEESNIQKQKEADLVAMEKELNNKASTLSEAATQLATEKAEIEIQQKNLKQKEKDLKSWEKDLKRQSAALSETTSQLVAARITIERLEYEN